MMETNIPTIGRSGYSLEGIILWSTGRSDKVKISEEEKLAIKFLSRCMELDPTRRISAVDALEHDFLRMGLNESAEEASDEDDDEMDMLKV
jgi:cell division control protein 7